MTREQAIDSAVRRAVPNLLVCLQEWHERGQDELDELIELSVTKFDARRIRAAYSLVAGAHGCATP